MSNQDNSGQSEQNALNVGEQQVDAPEVNEESLEGAEGEAQAPKEAKKEEIKRLNKLQLKVHGEMVEEELPFSFDENPAAVEYLTKQLQLAKAAQRAMQENGSYKTQVEQFFKSIKSDTKSVLRELGIDPEEFAVSVIEEQIKKEQMSPEQRELEELRQAKKQLEEERKKDKEDSEKRELERLEAMEFERIESSMASALEKSFLPKTPKTVQRIAQYMLMGVENGVDLTPDDVIPLVEKDLQEELKTIMESMGEDNAEQFIGKDVINRIRKSNIAKSKVAQTPATAKAGIKEVSKQQSSSDKGESKQSFKEFFKF